MPLLERGELLQRQRVDLAEHGQRALGGRSRLALLLAVVRRGVGRRLAVGDLAGEGHELVGAVVGDQRVLVETELLQGPLGELLDAHALLGAGHLVAVHGVDQLVVLAGQVAQRGPDRQQLLLAVGRGTPRPRRAASAARWIDTSSLASTAATATPTAWAARPSRISRSRRSMARARASRSASAARSSESARPWRARARSSLVRSARRASISAWRAVAGGLDQALARRRCRAPRRWRPGPRSRRLLELGEPGEVLLAGLLGGRHRLRRSARPRPAAAARLRAVVAELLGHGGEGRVGLVQLGERDVDAALGVLPLGLEAGDVEPEPLGRGDRLGQRGSRRRRTPPGSRAGWAGSAEPPAAKWAP